jgi:hypothetical protein
MKTTNAVGAYILYVIALFACCLYNSDLDYTHTVPEDESTHDSNQISVSIGAFPNFEIIPTDTPETANQMDYTPLWKYQSMSVPEKEQVSYWTLAVLTLLFISAPISFKLYLYIRRVRSHQEEQMNQLRSTEARIQENEENRDDVGNNVESLKAMLLERGRHDNLSMNMNSVKKIRKMEHKSDAQFHNDVDSMKTKTVNTEGDCHAQVHKEAHSMKIAEEKEEQVESMKERILKFIQEFSSQYDIEIDSIEIIEQKECHPVDSQNETNSIKKMMKGKDELYAKSKNGMDSKEIVAEMVDKTSAKFQKDLDPMKTREDDEAHPSYTLSEVDSMKTMPIKVGDKHLLGTLSPKNVWGIMNERLTVMHKDHIACNKKPKKSCVKKSSIKTSIAACQKDKKAEMKVHGAFVPGPNYKAAKSKVKCQNTILRHGESKVKNIRYRKPDYTKVQAKVDTWRKTTTTISQSGQV